MKKYIVIALAAVVVAVATVVALHARTLPPEPITQSDAERASQGQYLIVIAKVESGDVTNPGTRSESAFYVLSVVESLAGHPTTPLSAGRYTQKSRHYLSVGKQYLLVLSPGGAPGEKAYGLRKYEPATKTRIETVRRWITKEQETGEQSLALYQNWRANFEK
jgi:hypothetical protein